MNGCKDELRTIVDPKCQPYFPARSKKGIMRLRLLIHRLLVCHIIFLQLNLSLGLFCLVTGKKGISGIPQTATDGRASDLEATHDLDHAVHSTNQTVSERPPLLEYRHVCVDRLSISRGCGTEDGMRRRTRGNTRSASQIHKQELRFKITGCLSVCLPARYETI